MPGNLIRHRARDEDLPIQLTQETQTPNPGEVDQGCGVADEGQGWSDASSSSNWSAVVWIVEMP